MPSFALLDSREQCCRLVCRAFVWMLSFGVTRQTHKTFKANDLNRRVKRALQLSSEKSVQLRNSDNCYVRLSQAIFHLPRLIGVKSNGIRSSGQRILKHNKSGDPSRSIHYARLQRGKEAPPLEIETIPERYGTVSIAATNGNSSLW
jgi:hypothetical protein